MTVVEVALANLRRYLSAWHLHEPGARLGDDPEELHDLRVAGRRLDAILRQFRSSLPAPFCGSGRRSRQYCARLVAVRDLDVALSELEAFSRELPKSDAAGVEPLKRHLVSERSRARTRMLSVLDSVSVQKNLQELTSLLSAPSAHRSSHHRSWRCKAAPEIDPTALPKGTQGRGLSDVGFLDGGVSRGARPREEVALRAGSGGSHLRETCR